MSWAKFAPRARQSAGRTKAATTGQGNPWLGGTIGEAAAGAARTKTFLASRYRRVVKRRGKKRALVAVGNSILVIAWHLLSDPAATSPTSGRTGTTGSPRCAANASSPCTTPPDTTRP